METVLESVADSPIHPLPAVSPMEALFAFEAEAAVQATQNAVDKAEREASELAENVQRFDQEWDSYLELVLPLVPEVIRPFLHRYSYGPALPAHRHILSNHEETIEFHVPDHEPVICRLATYQAPMPGASNTGWKIKNWEVLKLRRDIVDDEGTWAIVSGEEWRADKFEPDNLGGALLKAWEVFHKDRRVMEEELVKDQMNWARKAEERKAAAEADKRAAEEVVVRNRVDGNFYVTPAQYDLVCHFERFVREYVNNGMPQDPAAKG